MRKDAPLAATAARPIALAVILSLLAGCASSPQPYGRESKVSVSSSKHLVWAVAPTVNLSGQSGVDPLLQSDLVYQQLQQVAGLTAIPVDRVATVYAAVGLERVQSPEQAAIICDLLGADALLVPTVTAWEPYNPPKMGASLSLFTRPGTFVRQSDIDPRELVRRASPPPGSALPPSGRDGYFQAVGMFDAADGSVREALQRHAYGRTDPAGPWGAKEFLVSSDRYASFVYRQLTKGLLDQLYRKIPGEAELAAAATDVPGGAKNSNKSSIYPDGGPSGPQPFPSNRR